jgi:hypothetical protein
LNNRFANFISVALHPLLMPTYLFAILFWLAPSSAGVDMIGATGRMALLGFLFLNTFMLPALMVYYLHRAGYIKDMTLTNLKDRRLPYFGTAIIYGFATYFFGYKLTIIAEMAPQIAHILGSIMLSILLVAIISLWWQISAHGVGIGGVLGAVVGVALVQGQDAMLYPLIILLILTGLVASARLRLNAHTPLQVLLGWLLGLLVSGVAVVYW